MINKILIVLVIVVGFSEKAYSVMIDVRTDEEWNAGYIDCLLYTSPSPRDRG